MGKKKENENLAGELASSFAQWEYLKEHGGSDPFYADGTNMNLVRNHIMYYKNRMVEEYGADYEKYPEIFYRELPPEVKNSVAKVFRWIKLVLSGLWLENLSCSNCCCTLYGILPSLRILSDASTSLYR